MAFSFSMSLMFIFMPPGIMMSPGFWSALQAPSHFASIVVVVSRGAPAGTALAVRGRFHGVGRIEVAGDFGMRGDRHAGDAADGIADIAGRGLLDVLLGAHLLAHRRERRAHLLVGGLVGAMLHRHLGHRRAGARSSFPTGRPCAPAIPPHGHQVPAASASRQSAEHNEKAVASCSALPACLSVSRTIRAQ